MRRRFLLWVLVGLMLVSCQPSLEQQRRQVDRLSGSFSTLEQLRVESYRNQDWCKNIAYRRGSFSDNLQSQTCNLSTSKPQAFDDQAQRDFEQVERAIAASHTPAFIIEDVKYAANGSIVGATFAIDRGRFLQGAKQYVYAPAYKALPQGIPNEQEYSAINSDWYSTWSDWN